jgi:hypothetical protein
VNQRDRTKVFHCYYFCRLGDHGHQSIIDKVKASSI